MRILRYRDPEGSGDPVGVAALRPTGEAAEVAQLLATPATIADPNNLRLTTTVSGELRQDASTSDMIFPVAELIAFLSPAPPPPAPPIARAGSAPCARGRSTVPAASASPPPTGSCRGAARGCGSGRCRRRSGPGARVRGSS
jgi:hypothetical protein